MGEGSNDAARGIKIAIRSHLPFRKMVIPIPDGHGAAAEVLMLPREIGGVQ
jgi:hypothetical protein